MLYEQGKPLGALLHGGCLLLHAAQSLGHCAWPVGFDTRKRGPRAACPAFSVVWGTPSRPKAGAPHGCVVASTNRQAGTGWLCGSTHRMVCVGGGKMQ